MSAWQTRLQSSQAWWDALGGREKALLRLAAWLLLAAGLWWVMLAPALGTLRKAGPEHLLLDAQLSQMRSLQAQAQALQNQPKLAYDEALRSLENSVKQQLGSAAQLNVAGDQASLTLRGASAQALAQWLTQARINARAQPTDARLVRSPPVGNDEAARWDGTLVLRLPPR